MTRKVIISILVLLHHLTGPLYANTLLPTSLTLQTCLEIAKDHNLELKLAKLNIEKAKLSVISKEAANWPQLYGSASVGKNFRTENTSGSFGFSLSQPLFPAPVLSPELRQAQLQLHAQEIQYQLSQINTRFNVVEAYYQLLYDTILSNLNEKILIRREKNTKLIEARYQAGRENKGTLLRAQAQLEQAKLDLIQSKRIIELSYLTLKNLLQLENDFTPSLNEALTRRYQNMDTDFTLENHPQLRYQLQKIEIAKQAQLNQELAHFPRLTASLKGSQPFLSENNSFETNAGAELSIPLFTGGSLTALSDLSKLSVDQEKITYQLIVKSLTFQVKEAEYLLLNASGDITGQEKLLEAAKLRSEIGQAQYNTGLLSYDNWDIIENDLISQEKLKVSKQRNLAIQQAKLDQVKGQGL